MQSLCHLCSNCFIFFHCFHDFSLQKWNDLQHGCHLGLIPSFFSKPLRSSSSANIIKVHNFYRLLYTLFHPFCNNSGLIKLILQKVIRIFEGKHSLRTCEANVSISSDSSLSIQMEQSGPWKAGTCDSNSKQKLKCKCSGLSYCTCSPRIKLLCCFL